MNKGFQNLSWFFAALILPRRSLAIFERLPLIVLCYLRRTGYSVSDGPSHMDIEHLLERIATCEKLFKRLATMKELSVSQICQIHGIVFCGPGEGRIRETSVCLATGGQINAPVEFRPPGHQRLRKELVQLLQRYNSEERNLDMSVRFFWDFVNLHPFLDGNGRVARLIGGAGLSSRERCIFNLFCAEVMFSFKHRYAAALSSYQRTGDYGELDAVCEEEIRKAGRKVDELSQVCNEFVSRLERRGLDLGVSLDFIRFPVRAKGDILNCTGAEDAIESCRNYESGTLVQAEINGTDFLVAEGVLEYLELLRPYRNNESVSAFNVA